MYRILRIILICLAFFLSSCQHHSIPKELSDAEKLLMVNHDSAYRVLDKMKNEMWNGNEYEKNYYQLLLFRAKDLCYIPHVNDSIINKVMRYCLNSGDNELMMQGYYCMGCYYRDKKDPQQALANYQRALDYSAKSNNYNLIGRIYNQMGHIEIFGYAYDQALPLYQKALYYFKLAKDSLTIPSAIVDVAHVYDIQKKERKALVYYRYAFSTAGKLQNKLMATSIANEISGIYYSIGQDDSAKYYIQKVNPRYLFINQNKAVYYSNKGKIAYSDDLEDSAKYFFNKSLALGDNNTQMNAYDALRQIYQNDNDFHNALKYSLLCSNTMEKIREETHQEEVTQLQSLYNYTRTAEKNKYLTVENENKEKVIGLLIIIVLVLGLVSVIYRQRTIRKREMQKKIIDKLSEQNRLSNEYIKEKEIEIKRLKEIADGSDDNLPIKIRLLQFEKEKMKNEIERNEAAWNIFRNSEIYISFHHDVAENKILVSHEHIEDDIEQLKDTIDALFNHFGQRLRDDNPNISRQQLRICYLIKAEFTPTEMSMILSVGKQAISNIRRRMANKYFAGIDSNISFDSFIHDF